MSDDLSIKEYENMSDQEKMEYWLKEYKHLTEQDVTPAAESLSKMIQQKYPTPEMILYNVDENYFESIDELLEYCRINKISINGLNILEYYREFLGRTDVIKKSNDKISILFTAVDEDGYGMYLKDLHHDIYNWEYNHGSIRNMYKPFRDKGIIFENDIYAKEWKRTQDILMYCKDNNLFNMGEREKVKQLTMEEELNYFLKNAK